MEKEKKLMTIIVIMGLCILWLVLLLINPNHKMEKSNHEIKLLKNKVDSLEMVADSLQSQILPTEFELGRHQVALEILRERNPKAASQFDDIISKETE